MSRDDLFRAPKGVHDVLPPESGRWTEIVARFAERAARYGYGLAITPMFEHLEVFQRVGEHTDVVAKEMYELTDKGGRRLALRPEGTASVVRAYVQHRPTPPWKVWYVAPNFRYERAQKGRYRQHWQLGVEALGVDDPDIDVEVIALLAGFYRDLGLARRHACCSTRWATPRAGPRYVAALRDVPPAATARALGRRVPRAGRGQPDAGARRQGRRSGRTSSSARRSCPSTCRTRRPRTSRRCRPGCAALGDRLRARAPPRPRLRLLHAHHVRVPERRARRGAERARRRRSLRRAGRGDGRSAHARDRLRDRARAHRARARRASGVPAPAASSTCSWSTASATRAAPTVGGLVERAADGGVRGRSRLRRPVGEGAVEGGRPLGRGVAVMVGRDELARDAVAVKDLATGEQVEVPRAELVAWLRGSNRTERVTEAIDEHADVSRRARCGADDTGHRGDARRLGRGAARPRRGGLLRPARRLRASSRWWWTREQVRVRGRRTTSGGSGCCRSRARCGRGPRAR